MRLQTQLAIAVAVALVWTGCGDDRGVVRPGVGRVTGVVRRNVWSPGSPLPRLVPVAGALVAGVDFSGERLWSVAAPGVPGDSNVTVTRADGSYELLDLHYEGGQVWILVALEGESMKAMAYESVPSVSYGGRLPGTTVNVSFPGAAPDRSIWWRR